MRASKTIVFDETLSSNPHNATTTRFTAVAPNRLSYVTRGGPAAIVIGSRRWDRERPGAPYVESSQTPLDVIQPYWQTPTNVHEIAPGVLTFLDRRIPAWFRLELGPQQPRATADDRSRAFHDRPLRRLRRTCDRVATALAVALRLLADDLEEAGCVLERREPGRRVARPPRATRRTADGRNRARGADEAADCERPKLACAALRLPCDDPTRAADDLRRPPPGRDRAARAAARARRRPDRGHAHGRRRAGCERRRVGASRSAPTRATSAGAATTRRARSSRRSCGRAVSSWPGRSAAARESSSASRRPATARWRPIVAPRSS